ncbi:MAG: hypothetical protein ACRYFS_25455 [Janthinobacterium lividum]
MSLTTEQNVPVYTSKSRWTPERPRVLVTCCSDGRLQEAIDEFLQIHLSIVDYDRFYAPGGPGALTPGGYEFLRATQYRDDLAFLVRAHKVEELLLIFHGAAPEGPEEATCAHYKRVLPGASAAAVREQQTQDLADLQMYLSGLRLTVRIRAFRAEVIADRRVQFVPML